MNNQKPSLFTNLRLKTWFFKTSFKMTYFNAVFGLFRPKITQKKFRSNIFRLNSTRAFDWCMNWTIWIRKNFGPFLPYRGDPYQKKSRKFFLIHIVQFIHQSKAKVYNAKNIFWIATLYRKIGRKNTFDFGGLYIAAKEVFWEN